jgi:hypothetical protein
MHAHVEKVLWITVQQMVIIEHKLEINNTASPLVAKVCTRGGGGTFPVPVGVT